MSAAVVCRRCREPLDEADRFCEACGVATSPSADDHTELDAGAVAAVTDTGRVRRANEDAVRIAARPTGAVAVVCDGVATARGGRAAADAAADAALGVLVASLDGGTGAVSAGAAARAVAAAQAAVAALPVAEAQGEPPSSTLVAAAWDGRVVEVVSVGDSRAYWLSSSDSRLLTRDDSWAQEQVSAGVLSEAEAMAAPQAHAITRWLGHDAPALDVVPLTWSPTDPGWLVLCTDGLWNHDPDPAGLLVHLRAAGADASALRLAQILAGAALAAGGHDNVTVAVMRIEPAGPPEEAEGGT